MELIGHCPHKACKKKKEKKKKKTSPETQRPNKRPDEDQRKLSTQICESIEVIQSSSSCMRALVFLLVYEGFWATAADRLSLLGHHTGLWIFIFRQNAVNHSFLAPFFLRVAIGLSLSLPLADKFRIFLTNPAFRYSEDSQTDNC